MNNKPKKTWEKFEQLVAAIHRVEMEGAEVKWNDKINGRQFDVTVRFKTGSYSYLTVVECKNYSTPVKAEKVEALITKYRDVNADKAVMFSARGFQSGAVEVAKKHGVHLYSVLDHDTIPEDLLEPDQIGMVNKYGFCIHKTDGTSFELNDEPMRLKYYVENSTIEHPLGNVTISNLTRMYQRKMDGVPNDTEVPFAVDFDPPGTIVFPPMENKDSFQVSKISWKMMNRIGRRIKDHIGTDPAIYETPLQIKNEVDGTKRYINKSKVETEGDNIAVGKYYFLRNLGYYYCVGIDGDLINMFMIESYQHGRFFQCQFTMLRENAVGYREVADQDVLTRLQWRLGEHYRLGHTL
ncbi:restriction endonuclease [Azospirillum sp. YIM B02556]|uniref:Restriction endonuclease n=1 Tax=Azospirillum endophyticum TaxID=2800326 RepID=A0ABS1F3K7_9PROT|nr:restriction endonuclease [Azospirillum endophyticum]MBK1838004.1 restriction endonuclease [Azospirillum endophyticum]